jgi:hypothetical protein
MSQVHILFSTQKAKVSFSSLIRLVERTPYSHVSILIKSDKLDRNLIYQANGHGVWFIGEPAFLDKNLVVDEFCFPLTEDQKTKLLQFAIDNSGKAYSFLQLIGIGCKYVGKLLGLNCKNPFSDGNDRYICVELVAEALDIGTPCEREEMGLKDLHDILQEKKNASILKETV